MHSSPDAFAALVTIRDGSVCLGRVGDSTPSDDPRAPAGGQGVSFFAEADGASTWGCTMARMFDRWDGEGNTPSAQGNGNTRIHMEADVHYVGSGTPSLSE